ncbi:MAG: glycogen synthase [Zunongwangia sp.]|jgi:starch synthase|uniref:starch synthase n=2 Tax=Zunongwangia profunda TaxID=398743 RepID=D5BDB3_ZUNPS|nr:glycogen/starch synthase [Zunongwangia profunda]MAC63999.1 glycogen synthase [Flavobacteriaceae bacterium]MAO37668.1 glycogen synthase [Zunongwangia sp.]ADF54819.1 glycogen synthase-like protein [Zunongwangia profunda SM-A87]MAG87627.1 glycogen synthase [Flavobacteriaceae bacterium]MCC4226680.1 glycogen/starch synthase [Zunongwangia profunda]|tara:strand:+ start:655 stop:1467 length:813 start_codon:yes stop_codon:yes gene_type:complete
MKDKRILYVSSEVIPYLPETEISSTSFEAAKMVNNIGGQIRIFMPRFGNINERRHQLHEVIRLSGMNMVINDLDMPLIIKVASIPKERMQVYFIDNEDYFKRKATLSDEDGNLFDDNDERAIFFAKGVIETVKKLNWSPDIIHVHGWLAYMLPLYLRHYYGNEPLFKDAKIVTSIYNENFDGTLNEEMRDKILFDGMEKRDLKHLKEPSFVNLAKTAADNSDAVIVGSDDLPENLLDYLKKINKPLLPYKTREEFSQAYQDFYTTKILAE